MDYICEDCKKLATATKPCDCEAEDVSENYSEMLEVTHA